MDDDHDDDWWSMIDDWYWVIDHDEQSIMMMFPDELPFTDTLAWWGREPPVVAISNHVLRALAGAVEKSLWSNGERTSSADVFPTVLCNNYCV